MAELKIENVKKSTDFDIFNFSFAIRGHFSNENTLLSSHGHLAKKEYVQIF